MGDFIVQSSCSLLMPFEWAAFYCYVSTGTRVAAVWQCFPLKCVPAFILAHEICFRKCSENNVGADQNVFLLNTVCILVKCLCHKIDNLTTNMGWQKSGYCRKDCVVWSPLYKTCILKNTTLKNKHWAVTFAKIWRIQFWIKIADWDWEGLQCIYFTMVVASTTGF